MLEIAIITIIISDQYLLECDQHIEHDITAY